MSGARWPLPLRLSRNTTLLVTLQFAVGCFLGHGFADGLLLVCLFPPNILGTIAVAWVVRELETPLPGAGPQAVAAGVLGCYLAIFCAGPLACFLSQCGLGDGAFVWPIAFAPTLMVALVMRRLVGQWVETPVVGLVGTAFAVGSLVNLGTDHMIATAIALLAWTALSSYFVGLWIEEAVAARVPA
jgi:hypothetical protein